MYILEDYLINAKDMQELLNSDIKIKYHIEQNKNNLHEFYTARLNAKMRLIMKPIGIYPYKLIEITEIEFVEIDNSHYGDD